MHSPRCASTAISRGKLRDVDAQVLGCVQAGGRCTRHPRSDRARQPAPGMDCKTFAEKSCGGASPNWSATMRWMDSSRSVVGAGETMCS